MMVASEEQRAEFAGWLDSLRDAAENADAEEPAAELMDVDAQQGVEQQGDEQQGDEQEGDEGEGIEQGGDEGEGIEQGRVRKRELMKEKTFECGNKAAGLKRRRLSRTFEFLTMQHCYDENPNRDVSVKKHRK